MISSEPLGCCRNVQYAHVRAGVMVSRCRAECRYVVENSLLKFIRFDSELLNTKNFEHINCDRRQKKSGPPRLCRGCRVWLKLEIIEGLLIPCLASFSSLCETQKC